MKVIYRNNFQFSCQRKYFNRFIGRQKKCYWYRSWGINSLLTCMLNDIIIIDWLFQINNNISWSQLLDSYIICITFDENISCMDYGRTGLHAITLHFEIMYGGRCLKKNFPLQSIKLIFNASECSVYVFVQEINGEKFICIYFICCRIGMFIMKKYILHVENR